jgi:LysM repeat protein
VFQINAELEGVHGLETATPTSTPGCKPRADWKLTYEVQPNDALERIATAYSTTSDALAEGNCLRDKNMIVVGQKLRVPGETHPQTPQYVCVPWEVLTPINGAYNVDGEGQLTFNWRGPRAERNLIRVIEPDGEIWERVVDLRQNETINLADELPEEGVYTWFVFPLDMNFVQIPCKEGGPWTFHKGPGPTPTPTPELTSTLMPALP